MDKNHLYNKDHLKALCCGFCDKMAGLFSKKTPLIRESRGGDFPGKTIFIVRRGGNAGLFSYFLTALSGMKYAFDRGWVPVIDMQTLPNIYLDPNEVGVKNAWEYYFEQPCGLSLKDVENACDVVITKDFDWPDLPPADIDFLKKRDGRLSYWQDIANKYIKIKPHVEKQVNDYVENVFQDSTDKILGVFIRGSDYLRLHPLNHTVQPTKERAVSDTIRLIGEYGFSKVFLVTEDKLVQTAFQNHLGEHLVLKEQNLVEYTGRYIGDCRPQLERKHERYLSGLDYLVNVLILCRCRFLLASRASGSVGAAILCNQPQTRWYYDLGVYTRYGTRGGVEGGLS